MVNLGIDISKAKFDVGYFLKGKKFFATFDNNPQGFSDFLKWVEPLDMPRFCMEATGCYHQPLAEFLHELNLPVSVVNPLKIKRFRESKLVRQKTDKSDAFVIAAFSEQNDFQVWHPKPKESAELTEMNQHIHNLNEDLKRWKNRLEKKALTTDVKADIEKKISDLKKDIQAFEKKALNVVKVSEDLSQTYQHLTEITGVGDRLTMAILAEMPEVSCFKTAEQYAAYVGVTPSHFQSGSSIRGKSHISSIGNHKVRHVLYMAALVVKNHNVHFQKWVKTLEKKGKPPKVIICAVMRKLISIIFGMLKNNAAFDPKLAFATN
jgi:transposase